MAPILMLDNVSVEPLGIPADQLCTEGPDDFAYRRSFQERLLRQHVHGLYVRNILLHPASNEPPSGSAQPG